MINVVVTQSAVIPVNCVANSVAEVGMSAPIHVAQGGDYTILLNKPRINGVTLLGDKTSEDIGIISDEPLSNIEIENLLQSFIG